VKLSRNKLQNARRAEFVLSLQRNVICAHPTLSCQRERKERERVFWSLCFSIKLHFSHLHSIPPLDFHARASALIKLAQTSPCMITMLIELNCSSLAMLMKCSIFLVLSTSINAEAQRGISLFALAQLIHLRASTREAENDVAPRLLTLKG
jgi:hypothetical protein